MENCRKYWNRQDAGRSLQKGLVAFLNHNDHFNVDYNEANELPDQACSHEFYEWGWNHCFKALFIRFNVLFN